MSPGSVLYAKQAGLAAWTFANQFVCEGESTGVKDGRTGHTAPSLCDIIAHGALVSHVCPEGRGRAQCWGRGGGEEWEGLILLGPLWPERPGDKAGDGRSAWLGG